MTNIHSTVADFSVKLREELEWLKSNYSDKVALIHVSDRFFEYLDSEMTEKTNDRKIIGYLSKNID